MDPYNRLITRPRNAWSRLGTALKLAENGDLYRAQRVLNSVKYHPSVDAEVMDLCSGFLARRAATHCRPPKINLPMDYLKETRGVLSPPFRRLKSDRPIPKPYPFNMVLPDLPGTRNDFDFIDDATAGLARFEDLSSFRVHVVVSPDELSTVAATAERINSQEFPGSVDATVLTGGLNELPTEGSRGLDAGGTWETLNVDILSETASQRVAQIAETTDLVIFLSGNVWLDELAVMRAAQRVSASDLVVQPFAPLIDQNGMITPFTQAAAKPRFSTRFPFREVLGLNFAVPSALLRRVGGLDQRFSSTFLAARELAFRMYNVGGYFAPLPVESLKNYNIGGWTGADARLYQVKCPNLWDRKKDGRYEVPKICVYIPAYNASKYIQRAVESVLEQDVQDLEVCIANDGSKDGTLDLLERVFGSEPRVRWTDNRNGGIGFASNRAIRMSNSLYIGQLDSDDALKPGAVRRLMEYLDENPDVVCCYGSCERIDSHGHYVKDEYSWPEFSREKMMITSIVHHFRMFRRQAWERTETFREDIDNAVDYDIFLKLSETGEVHHIDEKLYQRRWHGENTSNVNESKQTTNTYRVQREALKRQGLLDFWDVHVPDPNEPRRVTYKLRDGVDMVLFWPDYSRYNPYQKLLYSKLRQEAEVLAGDIDAALKALEHLDDPSRITFHLHWLNFIFRDVTDAESARAAADDFIAKLEKFVWKGGRLVWTIHNTISHDTPFPEVEVDLSNRIASAAHVLHFHCAESVQEVATSFDVPVEKVRISPHGSYVGSYPDYVTREQARRQLGMNETDDVLLFTGQLRPYKGVEQLVTAFRRILADRPQAVLIMAGRQSFDPLADVTPALSDAERARIRVADRFIENAEMQLFFRAADVAVYPYRKILTSGSMLLALSFATPVVVPEVAMTREVLANRDAGVLYDPKAGDEALETALRAILGRKDTGELDEMKQRAYALAKELDWPDFAVILHGNSAAIERA